MIRSVRMAAATLAILTLLPASVAATSEWRGQLSTQGLTTEGRTVTEGQLVAFFRYDELDTATLTPAQFELTTELARVETQQGDPVIVGTPGAANVPVMQTSSTNEYRSATFSGTENRPTYQFEVMALPGHSPPAMRSVSSCAKAEPSDRDAAVSEPLVNTSRAYSAAVSQAVLWHDCSETSHLSIEGSFMVILWEWDCQLEVNGQVTMLKSGYDQSESATGLGGTLYPAVATSRQQYVFVENGRLEFSSMDSTPHMAFLENGAVAAGNASFVGAVGQLSNGHVDRDLMASALTLRGDMALSFASQTSNGRLEFGLAGAIKSAEADGQPLSFTVAPGSPATPWKWIGLIGFGLVAVPVALLVPRLRSRHRHSTDYERARDLTNRDNPEAASGVSAWASAEPTNPEALDCLATLLARRGDLLPAWQHRQRAEQILVESPAMRWLRSENLLESAILARQLSQNMEGSDRKEWGLRAVRCLNDAVRLEPDLRGEVDRHPDLHAITTELDDADDWITP